MADTEALADLIAERDRRRADVRELASALQTAVWRLDDMLIGDDGQAWKEAERAMPPLRALLAKHNPLQALADNAREMGLSYEDGSKT